jgi:uncharacterized protein
MGAGAEADVVREVETPHGLARVHLSSARRPRALLVLGHGAGGGIAAPDLVAAAEAARAEELSVALVEQPYRAAGRRSPAPAGQLDAAWRVAVDGVRHEGKVDIPLVVGGRSSGARVACRTAVTVGAAAVLCLAFPLQPPPRRDGRAAPSRLPELDAVGVPVLVVQGTNDRFGVPPPAAPLRRVVVVQGDHGLRSARGAVGEAVRSWLAEVV